MGPIYLELILFVQGRPFPVAKTVKIYWSPGWWEGAANPIPVSARTTLTLRPQSATLRALPQVPQLCPGCDPLRNFLVLTHGHSLMKLIAITHNQVNMIMIIFSRSEDKVTDNIFRKCTFLAWASQSMVRHWRPSSFVDDMESWYFGSDELLELVCSI